MKPKAVIGRLILLGGALGAVSAAVVIGRHKLPLAKLYPYLGNLVNLSDKVKGINIDAEALKDGAQKKLIDRQPIMDDNAGQPLTEDVKEAATALTDQAKDAVQSAVDKTVENLKQLPKDQAAKITRQVCDQIVSELEKTN